MLKVNYRNGVLVPEEQINLQEGANVVLEVLLSPPSGLLGTRTITKVHAIYKGGDLILRRPLKISRGCQITVVAFSTVTPLQAFRGMLSHVKEDSVALQHKTKEWWSQSAH